MSKKVKLFELADKKFINVAKGKNLPKDYRDKGDFPVIAAGKSIAYFSSHANYNTNTITISSSGANAGFVWKHTYPIWASDCTVIEVNENISLDYFYLFLLSKQEIIYSFQTGAGQPHVYWKDIKNIEIDLPSLEKQRKIAKTLDKANELIELRKESITKLDALAKSIFIDMFGDPVSNPKGWELVTFDKLIEIKPKSIKPENIQELDKYVGLENIEKDLGNLINIKNAINEDLKSNKFHFDENIILYGKLRPYLNKVALPSFSGVCSTDILPIKVINANKIFVVFIIRHNSFVDIMTSRATGANLPRVNKSDLLTQKVFNPPIELQNKFSKIIEKIEEQKSLYEKELEKLEENFQALLQKSFQE